MRLEHDDSTNKSCSLTDFIFFIFLFPFDQSSNRVSFRFQHPNLHRLRWELGHLLVFLCELPQHPSYDEKLFRFERKASSRVLSSSSQVIAIQTVESLAVCLAQLFFLDRVYKLSKSLVLVGLLLPMIIGGVALGLSNAILTGVLVSFSAPRHLPYRN